MKITKITVYQVDLPVYESYNWSDGKGVAVFDSTVIRITTDTGIEGWSEVAPLGAYYLPSYPNGVRTGLKELCPQILGEDPREITKLNHTMDFLLKGHPYVKTGIDVACWDILGKFCNLPVCALLGGRYGESVELYRTLSQQPPEQMRDTALKWEKDGYRRFQLKLGGDPDEDIQRIKMVREALNPKHTLICDANCGWLPHQAMRITAAVKDLDVYIEQPCVTYEECRSVRRHTDRPFILDENIDSVDSLLRAYTDSACDVINIKISKLGGLTKARQARDLAVSMGIAMILEDTWGSDIACAAIAHFAHSCPVKNRFASTDFNNYCSVSIAEGGPERVNGTFRANDKPGLGVTPRMEVLGEPLFVIE